MKTLSSHEEGCLESKIHMDEFILEQIEIELRKLEAIKSYLPKEDYEEERSELIQQRNEFLEQIKNDKENLSKIRSNFKISELSRSLEKGGQSW